MSGGVVLLAPSSAPVLNRFLAASALIDDLPKLVAERREQLGITVKVAAAQIGITSTTLANFEAGSSSPTKNTIQAVLLWLGGSS